MNQSLIRNGSSRKEYFLRCSEAKAAEAPNTESIDSFVVDLSKQLAATSSRLASVVRHGNEQLMPSGVGRSSWHPWLYLATRSSYLELPS